MSWEGLGRKEMSGEGEKVGSERDELCRIGWDRDGLGRIGSKRDELRRVEKGWTGKR